MPRAKRALDPSPVQVIVGNQTQTENTEIKTAQETQEKPPSWFWDKLAEIPAESWKLGEYQVWITRLGDSRVPFAAGEKGYLDMFIEPITPATIKQKYGGGKYQAVLNRRGRAVTSHNFEIEGTPIFDSRRERPGNSPAALAAGSGDVNGFFNQVMTMLREELNHARENGQGSNSANEATVEMLSNAAKKAAEIMEKQAPQAGNPATMMRDMVSAMKDMGMVGANGGQTKSTLGSLIEELTPLVALVSPLIEKFFKPQDPMAQITTFMTIFDKLDGLRGSGSGGGGKTDTNTLILEGIKTLPSVIETMQANKAARQRPAPRQLPQAPAQPAGATIHASRPLPTPLAAPGTQANGAAPISSSRPLSTVRLDDAPMPKDPADPFAAPTPTANAAPLAQPTEQEFNTWVSTRMVEMLYLGFDGYDIVGWLEIVKPEIVRDLDKYADDQIESLFRMDPVLMHALEHPNWKNVLADSKAAAADAVADAAEADREAARETAPQFKN